jgi:hypothetical protein
MATALLILAALLPLNGLARVGNSPMNIPGVVDYQDIPASEAPQGGNAVDGLVVSLSTATPTLKVKKTALLTVTIANTSSESKLLWGPYAPCTYRFSVVNLPRNTTTDVRPAECFGDIYSLPEEMVSPGMATRLQFKFDSDALISEPGMYKVSVRSITLFSVQRGKGTELLQIASNPVSIVVTK